MPHLVLVQARSDVHLGAVLPARRGQSPEQLVVAPGRCVAPAPELGAVAG